MNRVAADTQGLPGPDKMPRTNHLNVVVVGLLAFALPRANGQDIPRVGEARPASTTPGDAVRVEWKLDRQTVPEDEELIATLVVSGVANPNQVARLRSGRLQPFESRFIIAGESGPPVIAGAKEVRIHLPPAAAKRRR